MTTRDTRETTENTDDAVSRRPLLLGAGYLLFGLGLVGLALPLMPTTVFWILAAGCFAKSSPRMYRRILAWPRVGPAVDRFLTEGAVGTGGKIAALSGMTAGAAMVVYASPGPAPTAAAVTALALAAAYVATRPSPVEAVGKDR